MWETLIPASIVVAKIVERIKASFSFVKGNVTSFVAAALGAVMAFGFDLTLGIAGAEKWADQVVTALAVGLGAGVVASGEDRLAR